MASEAHILVVDDEPGMREMMGFELTQCGHRVTTVGDGTQALAKIDGNEFDLVISDVRMPGADGIAVLKRVKACAPDTEVMIITGYTEIEAAIECVRGGACDLIHKPFDLADFLAAVERALHHRRTRTLALLCDATQEMFSTDGSVPLSERIARIAMRLLDADDVSIMLLDASGSLRIVFSTGIPDAIQAETRLTLGERVAGRVALDRSPAVLPEALRDDPRFEGMSSFGRVRSALVYPLVHHDVVLGVINLNRIESSQRFGRTALETAGIFATQAALALHNEALVQQLVASERLAAIGQLAAGVVHEINNPLVYITANADFALDALRRQPRDERAGRLLSSEDAQEIEQALSDVQDGAKRLIDIVADMRGLSRRELGADERFDVNDVIRSAMRIAGPTLRPSAELKTDLGRGLGVSGNHGRLGQVFLNLLVNASQAIQAEGRSDGRIRVRSWREDSMVHVEVADNGPGIPASHLSRVMEPFYTTKSKEEGIGLGLSISREVVEQHGGELRVESTPGVGATFTVSLRAAPPCEGADSRVSPHPRDEPQRLRLLFVDDDVLIRRAAERFFRRFFDLQVAKDGVEALEILQGDLTFDVVVTDIEMPRMNGVDLFREVCQRWPTLSRRVLILTGSVVGERDADFLQRSDTPVFAKPLDFNTLRAEIERRLQSPSAEHANAGRDLSRPTM